MRQALPQQIPGSMGGMRSGGGYQGSDNYQLAQAILHGGSLPRGASLGQSLGGSLSYQPPDPAAAAASLAANAAFMQQHQQQLMSGASGSFHTAHSQSGSLLPVGSLEALRHGWHVRLSLCLHPLTP